MTKTLTLGEAKAFINWFINFKKDKIKALPIKIQWKLLSNAKKIEPEVKRFDEFRDEAIIDLQREYFGDEKSEEATIPALDEFGKEILDEDGNPVMDNVRKVKEEYFQEYQNKINEINKSISELLLEKNDYEISEINIDKILDELPEDTDIELEDIEIMSFFE